LFGGKEVLELEFIDQTITLLIVGANGLRIMLENKDELGIGEHTIVSILNLILEIKITQVYF
jgi:hypothetical protein